MDPNNQPPVDPSTVTPESVVTPPVTEQPETLEAPVSPTASATPVAGVTDTDLGVAPAEPATQSVQPVAPAPAPATEPAVPITPPPSTPLTSMPPMANVALPPEQPQKRSIIKIILMVIGAIAVLLVIGLAILYFIGKNATDDGLKKADGFVALLEKGDTAELDAAIYDDNWTIKYICKKGDLESDNILCQGINNENSIVKNATIAGGKAGLTETLETLKSSDAKRYSSSAGKNKYGDVLIYGYYSAPTSNGDLYIKVTVVHDSTDDTWHVFNTQVSKTKPVEE